MCEIGLLICLSEDNIFTLPVTNSEIQPVKHPVLFLNAFDAKKLPNIIEASLEDRQSVCGVTVS